MSERHAVYATIKIRNYALDPSLYFCSLDNSVVHQRPGVSCHVGPHLAVYKKHKVRPQNPTPLVFRMLTAAACTRMLE